MKRCHGATASILAAGLLPDEAAEILHLLGCPTCAAAALPFLKETAAEEQEQRPDLAGITAEIA